MWSNKIIRSLCIAIKIRKVEVNIDIVVKYIYIYLYTFDSSCMEVLSFNLLGAVIHVQSKLC